ncbi:hypothetical protein MKY41_03295 [Sporosarcina sp. FSL W7-1349]|uniref:hypothetical protein n=1 Tax=Sporosarcina sp. FSL W7-1349 TaxID=2921561 RepID=UPI0030F64EEA
MLPVNDHNPEMRIRSQSSRRSGFLLAGHSTQKIHSNQFLPQHNPVQPTVALTAQLFVYTIITAIVLFIIWTLYKERKKKR